MRGFRVPVGVLCFAVTVASAAGQRPAPGRAVQPAPASARAQALGAPSGGPMLIETSAPILNLFGRADEGIAREDWKLAIDSLQRIIDDPEGALVGRADESTAAQGLFESARRLANRQIASLPPAGLEAYRILYDGKAKGLLERARAAHDIDALRTVVDRYLLTEYGDDAADLLASWCLDEGRPAEAVTVLLDLRGVLPEGQSSDPLISAKLATAYALLGQQDEAQKVVERELAGEAKWAEAIASLGPAGTVAADALAWPGPYRVMPMIDPVLDVTGLEHRLGGAAAEWWQWIHDDDPASPLVLPAGRLVSDGRSIYIRKPGGCAALDPDDLTLLWESTDPASISGERNARAAAAQAAGTGRSAAEGAVEDYIAESLTAAHDLVLRIERGSVPFRRMNIFLVPQQQQQEFELGTRLSAYDAATGRLRWQLGGEGELSGALFRATPVAVADELWVPYFRQSDFYVGVIRPSDGAVMKAVLLGSVTQQVQAFGPATPPAFADGIVFVPSGFGTLFAVDAHSRTVRWARQYDRSSRARTPTLFSGTGWLPAEPLVAGGSVILPPTDHRELVALSAATGETRWTTTVDGGAYLIASDGERIWIGGRGIYCISLAKGEQLWRTHLIAAPTGRAAVCGDLIYVPTAAGLLSLEAETGAALGVDSLAPSDTPLGNLLCTSSALLSLDPTSVRKFPDIERSYAVAKARFSPNEPASVARLARAELLRDAPQAAWELVEPLAAKASDHDPRLAGAIARIGVEAALRLAHRAEPGSAAALQWLSKADAVAASPADRIRCKREIAEQYALAGRAEEAYRTLVQLGLGEHGAQVVRVSEAVEAASRVELAKRLVALETQLSAASRTSLHAEVEGVLRSAVEALNVPGESRSARATLRAISDLHANSGLGQRALLALAAHERRNFAFERAELLLRECVRRTADPLLTAAGLVELCALYDRAALDWSAGLHRCLLDLEARFGAVTFPGDNPVAQRFSAGQTVADWVAKTRASAAPPDAVAEEFNDPTRVTFLTPEAAWTRGAPEANPQPAPVGRMVEFGGTTPAILRDRVILQKADGLVECIRVTDGTLLWDTYLRASEDFIEPSAPAASAMEASRQAVTSNQIAVFNHQDGLYAIGLLTGRRLWMRPYDAPLDPARFYARDAVMAAGDGVLAAMPTEGRLTLMSLADGSTIWDRDLRGESVDRIGIVGDRIFTMNGAAERLHILDRADGALIGQAFFSQPDNSAVIIRVIQTGGLVIGPELSVTGAAIVAVDIRTGEQAWKIDLDLPLVQLFEPQEGFLGLSLGQGIVRVVDVTTAEMVLERQVPAGRPVTGGALVDGTLILRADGMRQQKPMVELHAFDVATGEPVWQRDDVGALPSMNHPMFLEKGLMPALTDVIQPEVSGSGAAVPRTRTALALVNAKTGQNAGVGVDLAVVTGGARFSGDVIIRPGFVIVGTTRGVQAFRMKTQPRPDVEGDF